MTLPGVEGEEPFSFVVIGDTGEGDASQHVLRDQLLAVAARDDVRFVVVSSDVVYPSGAMRDSVYRMAAAGSLPGEPKLPLPSTSG